MPDIFDFTKISQLVTQRQPSTIILVDTNIVIKEPQFNNWTTLLKNPLFILSDGILVELEYLRNKKSAKESSPQQPFRDAIRGLNELFKRGNITNGINIKDIGWFLSVSSPKESVIKPELDQWDTILKAFGQFDTKLLILAKELNRCMPTIPVIFATGDVNLFNIAANNGTPSYLFEGFPMSDLDQVVSKYYSDSLPVDWDGILHNVQIETESKSVEVKLILTAKKMFPTYLTETEGLITKMPRFVAEGSGVIHNPMMGSTMFLWSLPYSAWDFPLLNDASNSEALSFPRFWSKTALLDFGDGDSSIITKQVSKTLAEQMAWLAFPLADLFQLPTLQQPDAIMKFFCYMEYHSVYAELGNEHEVDINFKKEVMMWGDFEDFATSMMFSCCGIRSEEEVVLSSLNQCFHAINNCWNIGDAATLRILKEPQ
ncbi:MAG: PIN domain-containing protein [Dehalococcoidia bacterium]